MKLSIKIDVFKVNVNDYLNKKIESLRNYIKLLIEKKFKLIKNEFRSYSSFQDYEVLLF